MDMSLLGGERIEGIDAPLPPGEHVRWQGRPSLWPLARRAFHVRAILLYFGALAGLRAAFAISDGRPAPEVAAGATALLVMGLIAAGLALFLAWLSVRTTIFAITDRRIVLRSGIVINGTVSIPFRIVDRVDTRRHGDGSGDVAIAIAGSDRIPYLSLWPYARPWRVNHPEPMFRAVSDFDALTATLSEALVGFGGPAPQSRVSPAGRTHAPGGRAQPMVAATP
jgi:hypothetical protein